MTPDIILILGLVLGILCIPGYLSALVDGRSRRGIIGIFLFACGMVFYAWRTKPDGYTLEEIPYVLIDVLALII